MSSVSKIVDNVAGVSYVLILIYVQHAKG